MSVFKPGDVAYLPSFGAVDITSHKTHGVYRWSQPCGESGAAREECLSFSPWPKPNHERPLEEGAYLVTYTDTINEFLATRHQGVWYWTAGGFSGWRGGRCINTEEYQGCEAPSHCDKELTTSMVSE